MFAPRSLRRSTSAPGRAVAPCNLAASPSSPRRSRAKPFIPLNAPSLAENAEKKLLHIPLADRQTDGRMVTLVGDSKMDGSTAAGDDSVAASEKSSDVGLDRQEETPAGPVGQMSQLRKTLSCSAKGILGSGKLAESASGPMLPPGSPRSPLASPRSSLQTCATSPFPRMLHRESTGPLLLRRTSVQAGAPCVPAPAGARLYPREASPPGQVAPPGSPCSAACRYSPVQAVQPGQPVQHLQPVQHVQHPHPVHFVPHAWGQQSAVQVAPPVQLRPRHSMMILPTPSFPCASPPQAFPPTVAPIRVVQRKVSPAGKSKVQDPATAAQMEVAVPEPVKDPAQVYAEEQLAKEIAEAERQEKARCEICEAVVEASQLDISATDLVTLRQARTKLLNALASAQEAQLPRVERSVAEQQRRRLHNALQDMKGQLRVSCRIRPLSESERCQKGENSGSALRPLDSSRVELLPREGPTQVFEFDSVFRPDEPQQVVEEIFEDCRDLVQSAVDGHNVTVMTYGQTGAGKTYTLFGNKDQEGLVQYMIREVFARLADQAEDDEDCSVSVTGSALELYNNHFIDLLRPVDRTGRQAPGVKVCVDTQGCVEVDGLAQLTAHTPSELLDILSRGLVQRVVAEHALNADSSRSHMVFTVRLHTEGNSRKSAIRKLTFCDLGGCERIKRSQVAGDLAKEAIEINKSLSALSSVIEAVAGRRRHVPYRDHKLTTLLRDAVGGSAKVLMYVCCSPARSNLEETSAALKLASRAAKVVNQQKQASEKGQVAGDNAGS